MRCTGEYPTAWSFMCPTCGARRAVTKDKVGGTMGAGSSENRRGYVRGGIVR